MACVYSALLKPQGSVQTPDLSTETFHLALGVGLAELFANLSNSNVSFGLQTLGCSVPGAWNACPFSQPPLIKLLLILMDLALMPFFLDMRVSAALSQQGPPPLGSSPNCWAYLLTCLIDPLDVRALKEEVCSLQHCTPSSQHGAWQWIAGRQRLWKKDRKAVDTNYTTNTSGILTGIFPVGIHSAPSPPGNSWNPGL